MDISHMKLVSSNEEPDDAQLRDITALVSKFQSDITGYTTSQNPSASGFTSTLASLQRYTQYRLVLSPIRRVPSEILTDIFHFWYDGLLSDRHQFATYPTVLAHVCRHWRALIRPMSPSCGTFVVPRGVIKSGSRSRELLDEFGAFIQSLPSPTESMFSLSITDPLDKHDTTTPLIDTIFKQSRRFVALKITIGSNAFTAFTRLAITRINNLRCLDLTLPGKAGEYGGYLYVFESATALQHVKVTTPMPMLLKFPIHRLLSYEEHSLGGINVPGVLKCGTVLNELAYTIHVPTFTPFQLDGGWIVPRNLESLDLRVYDYVGEMSWLGSSKERAGADLDLTEEDDVSVRCILPHLRAIRIRDPYRNVTLGFRRTICNSCDGLALNLTKMALCSSRTEPAEMANLLRLTPKLRYLECRHIHKEDLDLMNVNPEFQVMVPGLVDLVIHDVRTGLVGALEDFVRIRTASGFEGDMLRSVRLLYSNPKDRERCERALGVSSGTVGIGLDTPLVRHLQRMTDILDERKKKGGGAVKSISSMLRRVIPSSSRRDENDDIAEILTELEAISLFESDVIQLTHIHILHKLSLGLLLQEPDNISNRVLALLENWISMFQLQQLGSTTTLPDITPNIKPEWITINSHCISLTHASLQRTMASKSRLDVLSEYDILYGYYKPPTREEVFWIHEDCSNDSMR